METVTTRTMEAGDWEAVKNIYEAGISTGVATFEVSAPGWEEWDKGHLPFARLVAVDGDTIAGWAALSAVSGRCVYGGVAEVSVYVSDQHRGKGIGKKLLMGLIKKSEENGIWTLQAGIFPDNTPSIRLHEAAGFRVIGYREKIGQLKGEWKDNLMLEKRSKSVGQD